MVLKIPILSIIFVGIVIGISLSYLQQQSSASIFDNLFGSPYKTYSNETYRVEIDYPKDWNYEHIGYDKDCVCV